MSAAITRRGVLGTLALTAFVMSIGYAQPADGPMVIHRSIWDWSRADIAWYEGKPPEKREGNPNKLAGWAEFDVEVPVTGWWELYCSGGVPEWDKTYYVDGRQIYFGPAQPEDIVEKRPEIYKVLNLPLTAGMHTLQIRRTGFPGTLPEWFELRAANGNPAACITAEAIGPDIVRAGAGVKLQVTGGCPARATRYEFVAENVVTGEGAPAGEVSFPASSKFLTKTVVIPTPQEGCFRLRVQEKGQPLKPGDFLFHQFVVVDTRQPASPPNPLSWQERGDTGNTGGTTAAPALTRTLVAEVDCVAQAPLGEKDGPTRIVEAPFGKYRESSGKGTRRSWACDGFSYAMDIPDTDGPYMLEVDYPDDDRRTMGFWVNDQADPLIMRHSAPVTGGVETGDRYRCSQTMQTHQAVFWPNGEHLIVAVMNLNYSMRAAAAKIRVYKVEEPFPAGPPNRPDGRRLGYYYEESGRWLFHFGSRNDSSLWQNMLTMDRWARFSRYTGANLLYPTINMYQSHHAPSQVLEGYFIKQFDMLRLNALIAEKYGMKYLPEFGLSGQSWFDSRVMKKGMPAGEAWTLRDKDGKAGWYNALHPFVQEKYISILGETADRLGDCPSFLGVSSRLMCSWQWMGYNALPGMNWGYDDWTVSEFTRATGIKVPGDPQDEQRFRRRFEFLTGPQLAAWRKWRCERILDYHRRIRDRLRKARPDATLYFSWYGPARGATIAETQHEILREMGMDPESYAKETGIVILPSSGYGRRYSTPVMDARISEPMFNPDITDLGKLGDRGFGTYGSYFEVGRMGWEELGANNDRFINDVCTPAGRHELENYAVLLAENDCSTLTNGAFGHFYGTAKYTREFLGEYKPLPALRFSPLPSGRDPVAVWYRQCEDGFYFYAVNRERYPVQVTLSLTGGGEVVSLSSGQTQKLNGGKLSLELAAYGLRSFKMGGKGQITGCEQNVPEVEREVVAAQLKTVEDLAAGLRARQVAPELDAAQAATLTGMVEEARQAFERGWYWRARVNLERPEMIQLYQMAGVWPAKLQDRQPPRGFPGGPEGGATPPRLEFAGEQAILGDVRGKLGPVQDLDFDEQGNLWVAAGSQIMQFGPEGEYRRSLRISMPFAWDTGDVRQAGLGLPVYRPPVALRILPGDKLVAMTHDSPLTVHETMTGRILPLSQGQAFSLPEGRHYHLARDGRGDLYVSVGGANAGVWKYRSTGVGAFDFEGEVKSNRLGTIEAEGLVVDGAGRVYFTYRPGRLVITEANGELVQSVDYTGREGLRRLAVTPDGEWVFAATGAPGLVAFRPDANGRYVLKWEQNLPARVTALAISSEGRLVLGFEKPVEGLAVRTYTVEENGLRAQGLSIPALESEFPRYASPTSKLKEYGGALYYVSENRIVRLQPGNPDQVAVVFDPSPVEVSSLAFAPNGDLYLSSNYGPKRTRAEFVYHCARKGDTWEKPVSVSGEQGILKDFSYEPFDVAVDEHGTVYLRSDVEAEWPHMRFFARRATGEMTKVADLGPWVGQGPWTGYYGMHWDGEGRLYLAGGGTRAVACVDAGGKLLWERRMTREEGPGSLPLRGPHALTTDSRGRVWVADSDANRIVCLDAEGNFLTKFGKFGGLEARDGNSFCRPEGIATVKDATGQEWLYVADGLNQRIMKWRVTG